MQPSAGQCGAPAGPIHIEVFKSLRSDPVAAVHVDVDDDPTPATAVVTFDGDTPESRWPRPAKLPDVF